MSNNFTIFFKTQKEFTGTREIINSKRSSPVLLTISVSKGNDVRGSTAAVTDHNWDGRILLQTLQHDGDDVRTPLEYQAHHRDPLTQTWNTQIQSL